MARILITGAADGLGKLAAASLIEMGHDVVLHARNEARATEAMKRNPLAEHVLVANLAKMDEVKDLARRANELGPFDAVIHNAGVFQSSAKEIFAVNTIAPYILTCLIQKPQRLIYLSSGMHLHGRFEPANFSPDQNKISYSDSKLHVLMLCKAVARKWKDVFSNAVDPGWVPTKMGGRAAPDDLHKGFETQVWLATSDDAEAKVSGKYFFHKKPKHSNPEADDIASQDRFLKLCEEITGVSFPLQ